MKISLIIAILFFQQGYAQEQAEGIMIPDIPGYLTLKCDFHMHTIFSDGKVWPTVRVTEALKEGLDAIALTDHIDKGKEVTDVIRNADHAYEIAAEEARGTNLILIRGGEITFPLPPGHFNALFLDTVQKLVTKDFKVAFEEAKKQDAFFIWNHSNWKSPDNKWEQDGIARWFDLHTELLSQKMLMGMEVVNGRFYNREAHQWCIGKNLAMIGASDVHQPITFDYDLEKEHRPMTLVFARERSESGIKEALANRKTAVWFENTLIGDAQYLAPLFAESVIVKSVVYHEKIAEVILKNISAVDFILENAGDFSLLNKAKVFTVKAGETLQLGVKTGEVLDKFNLKFRILNMQISPENFLVTELECKTK